MASTSRNSLQGSELVQYFRIEPGTVVDTYSHEHEQTGYLVEGELALVVDGETVHVRPGDSYVDAVGVELFSPARPTSPWEAEDES